MDILQSAIDVMDPSPMMIVGNMNASLPKTAELSRCWYRKHPYNKHSFVLYDFLRSNDLEVVDFNFKQDVPYTFLIVRLTHILIMYFHLILQPMP